MSWWRSAFNEVNDWATSHVVTFSPEQISCVNWHHLILPKFFQFLLFLSKSVNHYRYTNENSRNWNLWKLYQSVCPSRIISVSGGGQWRHFFHFFCENKSRKNWFVLFCVYITWVLFHILTQIGNIFLWFNQHHHNMVLSSNFGTKKKNFFSRQIDCIFWYCIYVVYIIYDKWHNIGIIFSEDGGCSKFAFNFVLHAWSSYII